MPIIRIGRRTDSELSVVGLRFCWSRQSMAGLYYSRCSRRYDGWPTARSPVTRSLFVSWFVWRGTKSNIAYGFRCGEGSQEVLDFFPVLMMYSLFFVQKADSVRFRVLGGLRNRFVGPTLAAIDILASAFGDTQKNVLTACAGSRSLPARCRSFSGLAGGGVHLWSAASFSLSAIF